jgi:hypothetical protein
VDGIVYTLNRFHEANKDVGTRMVTGTLRAHLTYDAESGYYDLTCVFATTDKKETL